MVNKKYIDTLAEDENTLNAVNEFNKKGTRECVKILTRELLGVVFIGIRNSRSVNDLKGLTTILEHIHKTFYLPASSSADKEKPATDVTAEDIDTALDVLEEGD